MLIEGKGLFIWYASKLDPAQAVQVAQDHGIAWVVVKSADGPRIWDRDLEAPAVNALRDAGVRIFSWQYVYGRDPAGEAAAARWALDNGSELHVLDVEGEFEHNPAGLRSLLQACSNQEHSSRRLPQIPRISAIIGWAASWFPARAMRRWDSASRAPTSMPMQG